MNAKQTKLYKATAEKIKLSDGPAREIAILVDAREYAIRRDMSLEKAEAIIRKNVELVENGKARLTTERGNMFSLEYSDSWYIEKDGISVIDFPNGDSDAGFAQWVCDTLNAALHRLHPTDYQTAIIPCPHCGVNITIDSDSLIASG